MHLLNLGIPGYFPEERGYMEILWKIRHHMENPGGLAKLPTKKS